MESYSFRAMNTGLILGAEGQPGEIQAGFKRARAYIEACERRFTRFSEQSELSQLNASSGSWFYASDDLFDLVQQARRFVDRSGGLFNPAVLTALKAAGYDKSMDDIRLNGVSSKSSVAEVEVGDFRAIKIDPSSRGIWLPAGMEIDLGGIAKGWIAERAAGILSEYTTACGVNAGGDLFLIGYPESETRWTVGIEDPFDPSRDLAILRVNPGAVATSSVIKRRWQQGGQARHHLIDPRTGKPAETDWASVTVTAPDGAAAEVFAKVLLMAGSKGADKVAAQAPEITFVAVDTQGKLWGNRKSKELLVDGHFRQL